MRVTHAPAGQSILSSDAFLWTLVNKRGWSHVRINSLTTALSSIEADLATVECPRLISRPFWLREPKDVPQFLPEELFHEVPWNTDDPVDEEHPPHLVLAASSARSSPQQLRVLHSQCLEQHVALRSFCSLSTPSLEWAVLLVPAWYHTASGSELHAFSSAPGATGPGPSRAHTPAPPRGDPLALPCFHVYFLPFDATNAPRTDGPGASPVTRDPLTSLNHTWLRRRLSCRQARTEQDGPDIQRWRAEWKRLDLIPETGMPRSEPNVVFGGYWDRTQCTYSPSPYSRDEDGTLRGIASEQVSCVRSVMPGHHFTYSTRPWRATDGKAGKLEPMEEDLQEGFLRECTCDSQHCGGLRARRALHEQRSGGTPFPLEIRMCGTGARGMSVCTLGFIPQGAYVVEYVGIYMSRTEARALEHGAKPRKAGRRRGGKAKKPLASDSGDEDRQAAPEHSGSGYEAAGLHYTYDCKHTRELSKEEKAAALRVVDATHFGNAARFINHSCEANLKCINVCPGAQGDTHMSLMLRATRDIEAGEELTLNYYGERSEEERAAIRALESGPIACTCGAASCVRWLFANLPGAEHSDSEDDEQAEGGESQSCEMSWEEKTVARAAAAGRKVAPADRKRRRRRPGDEYASTGTSRHPPGRGVARWQGSHCVSGGGILHTPAPHISPSGSSAGGSRNAPAADGRTSSAAVSS